MRIENVDTVAELSSEDIIDSRDMEKRIDELEEEEIAAKAGESDSEAGPDAMDADHAELLKALREVREACGREWIHGVTYIRDSYFEDYARELADDIGAISKEATWPNSCIDWEEAASQLQQDYSSCEIDGTTYWYRD